jgi:putative membrane protein
MGLESRTFNLLQENAASVANEGAKGALNIGEIINTVVQSVIFVSIGLVVFGIAFWLITKVTPFSIRKEIEEDQNTALGVVIGSVIIGLAMIIASAIGG